MNTKKIEEFALAQLDNLGFQLRRFGITDRVNRHDIIAYAMTQQTRIKGEMTRLELKTSLQKARLLKLRADAEEKVGELIAQLPDPLAEPANRLKNRVFAA